MPLTPEINAILEKAETQGLFKALLSQLNKDFLRAGIVENFDLHTIIKHTGRNLVAAIYALIISDFERYLNLLYVIDIDEAAIKAMPIQRVDELAQGVSILILQRELAKVTLKNRP
ncbi:MAG TPA: hypothetical protein ENH91_05545 [Leeuwenhoekiella sp.]|nr:hypothetical protein [Leeuwenhoekiella sp.]